MERWSVSDGTTQPSNDILEKRICRRKDRGVDAAYIKLQPPWQKYSSISGMKYCVPRRLLEEGFVFEYPELGGALVDLCS